RHIGVTGFCLRRGRLRFAGGSLTPLRCLFTQWEPQPRRKSPMSILFSEAKLGPLTLQNHMVMSPLTRSRAVGNVPNDLMAEYYAQRATAGLIITEGTAPAREGLGYARIPGLFSQEQVAGWRLVTDGVHRAGGHIFVQLMHTGRVFHPLNLPDGAE